MRRWLSGPFYLYSMLLAYYRIAALVSGGIVLFTTSPVKVDDPPVHPDPAPVVKPLKPHRPATPYYIYLSFDDGPSAGSRLVNEISREDSIDINVFLIGHNACLTASNRSLVEDYRGNPLVELGNHSFTHADRKYQQFYNQPAVVLADINRNRDSLHLTNGLVRLPGRNYFRLADGLERNDRDNGKEAADTLVTSGYHLFGWDLEWRRKPARGFSRHTGAEMFAITENMLAERKTFLPNQIVILVHDHDLLDERFRAELQNFVLLIRADSRFSFGHLSDYDTTVAN